jgi:hypothetical protein
MSFHVNTAGNAGECRAVRGGCPFGSADEHFTTADKAREHFEKNMATETLKTTGPRFKVRGSFAPGEIKVEPLPKEFVSSSGVIVLPAGRYFVGDPCYTAGNDDAAWQDWCKVTDSGDGETLAATYNGLPVVGLHTAYGDGTYYDESGREYGVDAGIIGAVPEELIEKMNISESDLENSGHWVEASGQFTLSHGPSGQLNIGTVTIETDPEEPEDETPWTDDDSDDDEAGLWN